MVQEHIKIGLTAQGGYLLAEQQGTGTDWASDTEHNGQGDLRLHDLHLAISKKNFKALCVTLIPLI